MKDEKSTNQPKARAPRHPSSRSAGREDPFKSGGKLPYKQNQTRPRKSEITSESTVHKPLPQAFRISYTKSEKLTPRQGIKKMFFGIGFFELVIIAVAALLLVGPDRLPSLMRQFGRFFVQARRMSSEVKSSIEQVIADAERELRQEELGKLKKQTIDVKPLPPASTPDTPKTT